MMMMMTMMTRSKMTMMTIYGKNGDACDVDGDSNNAAAADDNQKEEKDDYEENYVDDYNDPRLMFRVYISSIHPVHMFRPINLCVHRSLP